MQWWTACSSGISIHALCEEGDTTQTGVSTRVLISIHALCEEGDHRILSIHAKMRRFLSTPSARRATDTHRNDSYRSRISIHALREEGDLRSSTGSC